MPSDAFPDDVTFFPSLYPLTAQGGANPVPDAGHTYKASVQPISRRAEDTSLGSVQGSTPQSFTRFDVLVPWVADDEVIPALQTGDMSQWGSLEMSVLTPADDFGLKKVWHIKCELVK